MPFQVISNGLWGRLSYMEDFEEKYPGRICVAIKGLIARNKQALHFCNQMHGSAL